jgi:electron transport complex protein RnfG
MLKIKYFIQQSWLLIVSAFMFGLLIAVTNAGLIDRIDANNASKVTDKLKSLIPDAKEFLKQELITIKSQQLSDVDVEIYKAVTVDQCQGWAFNASGAGFADKITLIVAVDKNFEKIVGFSVLLSSETPGFGDRITGSFYRDQFTGAPVEKLNLTKTGNPDQIDSDIVAISGATISSQAVVNIINNTMLQLKTKMLEKGIIQDVQ